VNEKHTGKLKLYAEGEIFFVNIGQSPESGKSENEKQNLQQFLSEFIRKVHFNAENLVA
jgi:hypothetical protein